MKKAVFMGLGLLAGGAMGYIVALHSSSLGGLYLALLIVLLAFYAQTVLHEVGHLIAGLLSGYRFVSFRVASLMLIRRGGRFRLAHYKLAGTGGQCLMAPPPLQGDTYPNLFYHLGGVLMNLLCATAAALLLWRHGYSPWQLGTLIGGLFLALTNGLPLKFAVDNDGRNALRSRREAEVRLGFYRQLQVNAALAEGTRLRDMPAEWRGCADGQEHERGYLHLCRLLDENDWPQARAYAEKLLSCDLLPLHRAMTENVLRSLTLLAGDPPTELSRESQKLLKAMRGNVSALCHAYVYALLHDRSAEEAARLRERFDRAARSYPYPNDLQSELELMNEAQAKFEGGE